MGKLKKKTTTEKEAFKQPNQSTDFYAKSTEIRKKKKPFEWI